MIEKKIGVNEEEAIEAYINKAESKQFYIEAFGKYQSQGGFVWVWSSWALFGGIFFLLYRKLYVEAIVFMAISILAGGLLPVAIIIWIASGGVFTFFIYKRYEKIRKSARDNDVDGILLLESLKELGGYNQWAIYVAVGLNVLFLIAIVVLGVNITNDPEMLKMLIK